MELKNPQPRWQRKGRQNESLLPRRLLLALFKPVDATGLVYFRIAFYAIMVWQVWEFITQRWVSLYFSDKDFYFTYWPFDFVRPWPDAVMTLHLYAMVLVASCAMLGLFYRLSATLFFFMMTYTFLFEQALYLNHWYLVCLISFLMIFVPVQYLWSLDVLRKPHLRSDMVPAWSLWLLRFQIGVPYFFGGIAKLNADWLQGEPLRAWLAERTDFPLIGPFFTTEPVVWFMAYASLFLDLFVVFFLLNRRTRVFAYLAALAFHFMNARLFGIGIFPWTMIAATAIFFDPGWPRRVLHDLRHGHPLRTPAVIVGGIFGFCIGGFLPWIFSWVKAFIGALGVAIAAYHLDEPFRRPQSEAKIKAVAREQSGETAGTRTMTAPALTGMQRWTVAFLAIWVSIQVLVPLRHFFIPGNVHWTEEGHNFAWHMKLRHKDADGFFMVTDRITGKEWKVGLRKYITYRQNEHMLTRPGMILQFVRYLEGRLRDEGYPDVEIRAHIRASLNGRSSQLLIDPNIDLTKVPYPWWGHAKWILPLTTPLQTNSR